MAKEEKPKESPEERIKKVLVEIFALALFIFLLARLWFIYSTDNDIHAWFIQSLQDYGIISLLRNIIFFSVSIGMILSVLFLLGITYLATKLREIQKIWHAMLNPPSSATPEDEVKNEKWQRILTHVGSSNSSDWRLAILECDIVLDELFDKLGYVGGTIGDKLKSVDPAHFKTLNNAWEAHKIRNAIAHEGQDFNMTDREARRVIGLYESVFKEFDFI